MTIYPILIFAHVISAIISIGPFFVLLPMLKKMRNANEEALTIYVATFQSVVRLVKHAGHVLVASGLLLMWLGHWPWTTSWIVLTFAVMFGSIFFLASAFKPTLKTFQTASFNQQKFVGKLKRATWLYILLLLIMLFLMVTKPNIW